MRKHLLFPVIFLMLGGCVSVPESVQLPESTPLLSYKEVSPEAPGQKDKMARWGGVIANIENQKDKTLLDLVYYPLRGYGRPIVQKESMGRFRVYVEGFLDPMVYQVGRSMTFAGEYTGIEEGLVGEHVYKYPTLQASGYHLWEDIDRIEIETISVWPVHRWGYPFGYRGWYGWPHFQRHVVTRRYNHHRNYHNNQTGNNNNANTRSNSGSSAASGGGSGNTRSRTNDSTRELP